MKTHNIIYKNNKFYDTSTGKRVYPQDNGKFVIAGDNQDFGDHDPLNKPHENIFDAEQQLVAVKAISNLKTYKKILPVGESLFFDFSLTKTKHENEQHRYKFRLELLEDLYLHTCTTWNDTKPPELHDCRCVVIEDLMRNVEYFEPIYATSINEAYSKTRQFYFPNQGTPGGSVYITMKCFMGSRELTLAELRKREFDFDVQSL